MPKKNSPKNRKGYEPTLLHKKVAKAIVEKGGKVTMGGALRAAGASESLIKNPDRVFKSPGFAKELEKVGLSDKYIASKYRILLNATRLEKDTFYAEPIVETKRKKETITGWQHMSDAKLKLMIEGSEDDPTGVKIAYIKTFQKHKEVFYRVPDSVVQKGMIELTGKVKSHFAPEQHDLILHELDESERKLLQGIIVK
jgi:hypothetical protein